MPVKAKGSKLWLVVLLCVAVGIGLGVFVYQQSIAPKPKVSPKPAATPVTAVSPTPSPAVPEISQVTQQSNEIVFPKAGEVRVYMAGYDNAPTYPGWLIKLTTTNGSADLTLPNTVPAGDKMAVLDSGITVTAGQKVTIRSYDYGNLNNPSVGWIKPDANNGCGAVIKSNASPLIAWATQKTNGEPLVSVQCWSDNGGETPEYNDFLVIMSYVPPQASGSPSAQASASPAASASVRASASPAASASVRASASPAASPSPLASRSPSPSPSALASAAGVASQVPTPTPTPTPSARVTMPEGSALPDAGIFEVTVGTAGVGLVLILLGLLGMLLA